MNCPACGAKPVDDEFYVEIFKCGSNTLSDGSLNQGERCSEAEKKALKQKIQRLEAAGDRMAQEFVNKFGGSPLAYDWCQAKQVKP